jgi:hypothetical protein
MYDMVSFTAVQRCVQVRVRVKVRVGLGLCTVMINVAYVVNMAYDGIIHA